MKLKLIAWAIVAACVVALVFLPESAPCITDAECYDY